MAKATDPNEIPDTPSVITPGKPIEGFSADTHGEPVEFPEGVPAGYEDGPEVKSDLSKVPEDGQTHFKHGNFPEDAK